VAERKNLLFVNKKKQKNFINLVRAATGRRVPALPTAEHHVKKVFLLLFFQKKKTLPSCRLPFPGP
jgi:hypothetical protein